MSDVKGDSQIDVCLWFIFSHSVAFLQFDPPTQHFLQSGPTPGDLWEFDAPSLPNASRPMKKDT